MSKYINTVFGELTILELIDKKFKCKCSCGNIILIDRNSVVRGKTKSCGCLRYKNKLKFHTARIGQIINNLKILAVTTIDNKISYECLCTLCNNITKIKAYSITNVKSCGCLKTTSRQFKPNEMLHKNNIGKKFNNLTILDVVYKNSLYYYRCECTCGKKITVQVSRLLNNYVKSCGCLQVISRAENRYYKYINHKFNKLLVIDVVIEDNKVYFKCQCDCGNIELFHVSKIKEKHSLKSCYKCQLKIAEDKIKRLLHSDLQLIDEYKGLTSNLRYIKYNIKCTNCELVFKRGLSQPSRVLCPNCYPNIGISSVEINFNVFLNDFNISYDKRRIKSKYDIQDLVEIDFLVDNIGIELHGLTTHSSINSNNEKMFIGNKSNIYHLNKTESCEDQGIDLIQFWNTEWIQKSDICKSIILNRIGRTPYKTFARKCIVREIDKFTYNEFMNEHHLQGTTSGDVVRLGLFFKENSSLVSVMSFGRSRFSNHQWEMFRFATHNYSQVVGGASKLFKYFIRNWNPDNIVSYSDRRIFNSGGLYNTLGFKYTHNSNPNYWYFKNNNSDYNHKLFHRASFMKHKLKDKLATFDPNLSEWENMEMNGYLRVYDCGNKVYIWNKDIV